MQLQLTTCENKGNHNWKKDYQSVWLYFSFVSMNQYVPQMLGYILFCIGLYCRGSILYHSVISIVHYLETHGTAVQKYVTVHTGI